MLWYAVPPHSPARWRAAAVIFLSLSHVRHRGGRGGSPSGSVHHQGERHQREQGEPRQRHRSCHGLQEVQAALAGERRTLEETSSAVTFDFKVTRLPLREREKAGKLLRKIQSASPPAMALFTFISLCLSFSRVITQK